MEPSAWDKLSPEQRGIADRFNRTRLEVDAEVARIYAKRRRRAFLQLLPRIIAGCAGMGLIGAGIGWALIQVMKP